LIVDEIQTGIGRTGTWFAYQQYGIQPDIVTLAKGIASGMPLGATIASKALMSQWTTGSHGSTYTGNPVTCAAGLATINVLEPLIADIPALSKTAFDYLRSELSDHPHVGDIRGMGYMFGVEFVSDKASKVPSADITKTIMQNTLKKQLITINCGVHENVIRLLPPLIIDQSTLMKGLKIFVEVVKELK